MKKRLGLSVPFYMIISALSFVLMSAVVKQTDTIPVIGNIFFRIFLMPLLILPLLVIKARLRGSSIYIGRRTSRGWANEI